MGPDAVDGLGQGAGDSPGLLLLLIWVVWSYLEEGQEYDRMLYPDECYTGLKQSWFADDGLGMADIETIDEEGLQNAQGLLIRYNRAFEKVLRATGQRINLEKTDVLLTMRLTTADFDRLREVFDAEGWPNVQLVYEVKHLGVWQGPDVTGGRIWRDAIAKAIARVGLWRKSAWGRNVMAIIWRVFIVTLFSYLGRFHSYPAHAHTELNQMLYQAAR